jgi:hypothetical protein
MDEDFEAVPLEAYLDMNARLIGRIQALEVLLMRMLAERQDLAEFAKKADNTLLHDEESRIHTLGVEEETIQTHEWARQAMHALIANAVTARKIR